MAHGGYDRRRLGDRRPSGRRPKPLPIDKKKSKKSKFVSVKNQIRSTERFLRKELPPEVRQAQEQKLDELKKRHLPQVELQTRIALEKKTRLRDKRIKSYERRKVERMIRRLEKQQRASSDHVADQQLSEQLSKLKEDLEYTRFFPKTEKYVSLFVGGDNLDIVVKRNKLRDQIKENIAAAAAKEKDLEETASDHDALDMSEDDFFLSGSSSDAAEADDEWTDKSTRESASSASGKATSGMSSDEKNQKLLSARVLMPPPPSLPPGRNRSVERIEQSTSSTTSHSRSGLSSTSFSRNVRRDHYSDLSSASDAHKPRRKRRPKKKKQA